MSLFTGIILYMMIYWTVLFTVLPWGNRAAEASQVGTTASAPANPRIKQKFLITGVVAAVVWTGVFLCIHFKVIDFYAIAKEMTREDDAEQK